MIRVLFFLVIVGVLSAGAAWLADRPGDVVVTWQGMYIKTTVMIAVLAAVGVMAGLALILAILRAILRSPIVLANRRRHRRGLRAYRTISDGLVAVGSGDLAAARRLADEVNQIAPGEPLALLLGAQAAQLAGDRNVAERIFRTMAGRNDTRTLGLHGLFVEARRRADAASARAYAEEAARTTPGLHWAGRAVLEYRCAEADWAGALAFLEQSQDAVGKESYRRQRAVLLTARAHALAKTDRDAAKASSLEAVKLAPTLVPAAALFGRLLAEDGELRKAARVIGKAWRAGPHPDLAQAYANLRFGDAARDRLVRIEKLARSAPGNVESALAHARAALDAREFGAARTALAHHVATPMKRVALLMAELERAERNDEGRAREWLRRAVNAAPDPAWTADGYVSDRWLPVSPVTGRLDAFEWRVPLTGILSAAPVIEPEPAPAVAAEPAAPQPQPEAEPILPAPVPAATAEAPADSASQSEPAQPKSDPVIPLVHAPDDPGDETEEASEPPPEKPASGWRKLFG